MEILQGGGQGGGSDILSLLGPLSGALSGVSVILSQTAAVSKPKQHDSQTNKPDIKGELQAILTLRLLMSYIYMELLVKPEMLTSYIYGPRFGNAETVSFYLLHNVSTLNQCREVSCVTFVCKHFAS